MAEQRVNCGIYTMVLVENGGRVLLLNRPDERGFPGYLGPGGKVELTESIAEGAARELFEETGLRVRPEDLRYKGLDEYVVPATGYRYMVFNYTANRYEGELLADPPEGALEWVDVREADKLPMQDWFRRRLPLFFEDGTFEITVVWDEDAGEAIRETVRMLRP